jgi:hypothetical protein
VGTSLTKVVDPLYTGGKTPAAAPKQPTGSFSFRLLPKAIEGAGTGEGKGESTLPERVTVDFDALPEQYRPLVRTYFELLARESGTQAGDHPKPREEAGR